MEQAEKDAYKKDYNSRLKAHRISVKELYGDSEQQLRLIIDALYSAYQKGQNVYFQAYAGAKDGIVRYNIYSQEFEDHSKDTVFLMQRRLLSQIEHSSCIKRSNGSNGLPQEMMQDWENPASDTVYVYNNNNGMSFVFTRDDYDTFSEDFEDFASIELTGMDKSEYLEFDSRISAQVEESRKLARDKALANIPKWLETGKSIISEDKYEEWEQLVNDSIEWLDQGQTMQYIVKILSYLNQNNIQKALAEYDSIALSGHSEPVIRSIIERFAKLGASEFLSKTTAEQVTLRKQIINARQEKESLSPEATKLKGELNHLKAEAQRTQRAPEYPNQDIE